MSWFVLTLIAPALLAVVNHFDKYLLQRHMKGGGIGSLVIFSCLIGLPAAILISLFVPGVFEVSFENKLAIILTGTVYISWLLPYLYALEKDETSFVTPIFQTSSIFSYLLGYFFLGENLSLSQLFGAGLILLGSIALAIEVSAGNVFKIKYQVFLLILLSSFLYSINGLLFKTLALQEGFWITSFWQYIGTVLTGAMLFLFDRAYRDQFIGIVRQNSIFIIGLNAANEIINIGGKTAFDFATLLAPLALVYFVSEGFQPVFVLLYGILLTLFFPKIAKENIEKKYLLQKILSIGIIFVGTLFIHLG